jgi:hypothetical protein
MEVNGQGRSPWYPLDRRLGGPQKPVWVRWWREKFPAVAESHPAHRPPPPPIWCRFKFSAIERKKLLKTSETLYLLFLRYRKRGYLLCYMYFPSLLFHYILWTLKLQKELCGLVCQQAVWCQALCCISAATSAMYFWIRVLERCDLRAVHLLIKCKTQEVRNTGVILWHLTIT